MTDEMNKEILGEKFRLFLDNEMPVHITNKKDSWFNGYVKEVGSIFVIIDEFKLGRKLIFYDEIFSVEHYLTKEGKKENGTK